MMATTPAKLGLSDVVDMNYKAAYERQKKAREKAEFILENKSRELYDANQSLIAAYSKLKNQKSQILHQEKLASIGQLAAGVAHEINNPTGFVKGNINSLNAYISDIANTISQYEELIKSRCEGDSDIDEEIAQIRKENDLDFIMEDVPQLINESLEGLSRIENIVTSLKDFSRPDSESDQEFSLNKCVEDTLRLVNSEVKYKADLEVSLGDIPMIAGQPGAVGQVVLNLVVNAADALETSGNIRISTARLGSEVRLDVSDNGPGIPQNLITRIFDPFFTTKDVGKGTGLGLSISHNIVQKHGGRMAVDSKEGLGTEFSVFFPIPTEKSDSFIKN